MSDPKIGNETGKVLRLKSLKPAKPKVEPEIVKLLENLLGRAKRGDVLSVAVVISDRDDAFTAAFIRADDGPSLSEVIGNVEILKSRIMLAVGVAPESTNPRKPHG